MSVPTLQLNNGTEMPAIGLGTFMGKDIRTTIKISIRTGYRLIDTAFYYNNQTQIGEAIKEKIEDGTVARKDLFIVEKLWNTQHQPDKVIPALKSCLSKLQMDYVDAFLMHWPIAYKNNFNEYAEIGIEEQVTIEETWKAMEECVCLGYAKSIGVSNFNCHQIERVLKIAKYKPVINQVECHPYINQKDIIEFCRRNKIVVMSYSPLYGAPRNATDASIFKDPVITNLALKYNKFNQQIVLRYLIQLGVVPIPKSDKPIHIKQNLSIFDFELDFKDMEIMTKLNMQNKRYVMMFQWSRFREYPFKFF